MLLNQKKKNFASHHLYQFLVTEYTLSLAKDETNRSFYFANNNNLKFNRLDKHACLVLLGLHVQTIRLQQ